MLQYQCDGRLGLMRFAPAVEMRSSCFRAISTFMPLALCDEGLCQ